MVDDALETRTALPDALRVLVDDIPREVWESHPQFSGLVQFWLSRHAMFRELMAMLETDAKALLSREMDPAHYPARLSRLGGMLVNELHTHHGIEDQHYFPKLKTFDARIASGFDLLDRDHHAMDGLLADFATAANDVLAHAGQDAAQFDAVGGLVPTLDRFHRMLDRHLSDEEDLVVPVILTNAGADLE